MSGRFPGCPWLGRLALVGALAALAGCSGGKNYDNTPAYSPIGGTVSGLRGTLVLANSDGDTLTLTSDGRYQFALSVQNGSNYSVTVKTQPIGQVCTVANATGTVTAPVADVAVTCHSNVTIGGTVAGLAGTVVLQENGGNDLAVAVDGVFSFTRALPYGTAYSVTVLTAPPGQTCTVNNGNGTATTDVTTVSVVCGVFQIRPLPAAYTTGKAINYSAYRAGGPGAGEVPSDSDVLQDLGLLHTAGYTLLRLFGADAVADKILRIAAANYPEMSFHLGIFLEGAPATCIDAVNQSQIATGIRLANTYPNVAAVSVGNETSFANNLPVTCLASYIKTVRSQVSQPVTADDDYTFYAGLTASGEKPDSILPLLDFVSIHIYPFSFYASNPGAWDWQQLGVAAGPARASAMMNASLAAAKRAYGQVENFLYRTATGQTVTVGSSLPIVIGETGWKARQTNSGSTLETFAALPANQKFFFDLLYGNPATSIPAWQGTAGGPVAIFWFEGFDEAWKGADDGWGLWDSSRTARYVLCGTPAGSACSADVYAGAGYFH